ncbi:MAG TPA: AbrB/MazE/SpoVT family DNA-binding domain-containing protein [Ignavibacteria bacterium]|nr:AbrB/MazE/SpoVT family DNA-binding domain-containing protein [Ignavibacteria bacterium]
MSIVTVSPKYQVVIPKEIRKKLKLKPGQKLQITEFGDGLFYSPVKNPDDILGIFEGVVNDFKREKKDRI